MSSDPLKSLTSSAISMVVAGNTGVTPFLTLLVVALLERSDPDLLNMQGKLEEYLASDAGIAILAIVTVLEFLSMCIPVVDEMVDSGMTFIIPIISAIASASTFGLFLPSGNNSTSGGGEEDEDAAAGRLLQDDDGVSWIGPLQVFLMIVGIVLALSIHFFKMIVRLIGEGWLTGCLTIMETIWTISTIFIVLYIQSIAIVLAIVIGLAAGYGLYRLILRIRKRRADSAAAAAAAAKVAAATSGAQLPPQQQQQQWPQLVPAHTAVGGGGTVAAATAVAASAPDSTYDDGLFPTVVVADVELGSTNKGEQKHWSEQ